MLLIIVLYSYLFIMAKTTIQYIKYLDHLHLHLALLYYLLARVLTHLDMVYHRFFTTLSLRYPHVDVYSQSLRFEIQSS